MALKFLNDVSVSNTFRKRWTAHMSGWCNLHDHLPKDQANPDFYAKLMCLELERPHPRVDILLRLKGAFDVRRKRQELLAIMDAVRCGNE